MKEFLGRFIEMIRPNNELIEEVVAQALEYVLNTKTTPKKRRQGKTIPDSIRKKISSSDGKVCPLCGVSMIFTPARTTPLRNNEATWEHVLDLSLGGSNTLDNTAIICHSCNTAAAKLLTSYLGINGEVLGSIGWKNEFVKDKRNLFRLHKYLEWKMKAILLERIDGGEGLGKLWTIARWGDPGDLRKGEAPPAIKSIGAISVEKREISPLGKFVGWLSTLFGARGKRRKVEKVKRPTGELGMSAKSLNREISREENKGLGENRKVEKVKNPVKRNGVSSVVISHRINMYLMDNDLEETGSKALIAAFGLSTNISLNKLIVQEFSDIIDAEPIHFRTDDEGTRVPSAFEYRVKTSLADLEEE